MRKGGMKGTGGGRTQRKETYTNHEYFSPGPGCAQQCVRCLGGAPSGMGVLVVQRTASDVQRLHVEPQLSEK